MGEGGGQQQIEETHELLLFLQVIKSVLIISEHFHKFVGEMKTNEAMRWEPRRKVGELVKKHWPELTSLYIC